MSIEDAAMPGCEIHYPDLIDPEQARLALGVDQINTRPVYGRSRGFVHTFWDARQQGLLEVVNLNRDVLLVLHQSRNYQSNSITQVIRDDCWMHFHFCVNGHGSESLGNAKQRMETRDGMCTMTGYAGPNVIHRELLAQDLQRTACLYLRPHLLKRFFRVPEESISKPYRWITGRFKEQVHCHAVTLPASSAAAVQDMLACPFEAQARMTYMQAKSAELLATLLHALSANSDNMRGPVSLRNADVMRLTKVKKLIDGSNGVSVSVQQLARQVGLNRSKLSDGFATAFGTTIDAYARHLRLTFSRDMLRSTDLPVAVVAEKCGYAEVSSFSRAFMAKFGVAPKTVKSSVAAASLALARSTDRDFDSLARPSISRHLMRDKAKAKPCRT